MGIEIRIHKGKDLYEKAITKFKCLADHYTEINGVKGVDEMKSDLWQPLGAGENRNEKAAELYAKFESEYPYVDNENKKEFLEKLIEYYTEAKKYQKVVDNCRSVDVENKRIEESKKRDEESNIAKAKHEEFVAKINAKKPSWAQAYIVATYEVDKSDSMTDYYSSQVMKSVVIGFRSGKKEDFRQLRSAAVKYEPTKDLDCDEAENRENYSMGRGNYLKKGGRHATGWAVHSTGSLYYGGDWEDAIPEQQEQKQEAAQSGMGCVIRPGTRDGYVEVVFPGKPEKDVIDNLKASGFRFTCGGGEPRWYGKKERVPNKLKS